MNSRNDFLNNGAFTISTNFLIRVLTKAFTFILISTLLTILIVTIHAPDALSLDTSFSDDGILTTSFPPEMTSAPALPFNPTTKLLLWVLPTTGVAVRTLQWHATWPIYN